MGRFFTPVRQGKNMRDLRNFFIRIARGSSHLCVDGDVPLKTAAPAKIDIPIEAPTLPKSASVFSAPMVFGGFDAMSEPEPRFANDPLLEDGPDISMFESNDHFDQLVSTFECEED